MAELIEIPLSEGDKSPALALEAEDEDLTGWTFSAFVEHPDGTIVTKAGTIATAGPSGTIVNFDAWLVGEIVPGRLRFSFKLTPPGGNFEKFPKGDDQWYLVASEAITI